MSFHPNAVDAPPSYLHQHQAASPLYTQNTIRPNANSTDLNSSHKPPILQPWLGLQARLFLAPISIPLISLLFVAARMLSSSNEATDSISSAKGKLLSACSAAEGTASLAASFPHFLAASTNVQLALSVTATVHSAARVFDLSMTAIQKILTYIVNSYKSLFMCFMELLVRGALAVLITAVEFISQAITAATLGIRSAIQESITGVNTLLATAVGAINDVIGVFGQHVNPPHIAVPSLTSLENITLPHEIQDGLVKLNATLPTLQQLKQSMDALIETPFEEMKREVNATLASFQFNHSVFPVPEMQNVTFCDRIDTSPLDELGNALKNVARWGLVALLLIAIVVMLIGVAWEWWKWQKEVKAVERTRSLWLAQRSSAHSDGNDKFCDNILKTENLMSLLTISQHPLISFCSLNYCKRLGIRTRRAQDRCAWLLSFLMHPASLACLFTGVLGLISVLMQAILVHSLSHHYVSSIDTSLAHLSSDIVNLVNDHTRNASVAFSTSANTVILQVEAELNDHVFRWVDTTTSTMNSTLNQFVDGLTETLTSTFGGTPFNAPLQTFVQCILGQKVQGIEKALTWIHENAYVNFSVIPADVLMLRPEQQEAVLRPVREAMLGSRDDQGGGNGVVGHVISRYMEHLHQEKILFTALIGVYAIILLIGLLAVLYATLAERRMHDDDETRKKVSRDESEEKLRSDLQAGPGGAGIARLWSRRPKLNAGCFRAFSHPPVPVSAQNPSSKIDHAARFPSSAHSSRPDPIHVTKDSISYPFQMHHSLNTSPSTRPTQPTPLQQTSNPDRDTVQSLHHASTTHNQTASTRTKEYDSWLCFLASYHDGEATVPAKAPEAVEGAQDIFHRLFGCSLRASPTVATFNHHVSAPAVSSDRAEIEVEDARFRETLDLGSMQDWIGSKSPIPPPAGRGGSHSPRNTADQLPEVQLTRSGGCVGPHSSDSTEETYAFTDSVRLPPGPQPQQKRVVSSQSISFFAW